MNIKFNSRELVLVAHDANDAKQARQLLELYLRRLGTAESDYYSASLAFGELIANVIRHAPGSINVRLDWSSEQPVLSVADHGPGFELRPELPQDPLAEGGRGLFIVASLASDLSVERVADNGMVVRATLPVTRRE